MGISHLKKFQQIADFLIENNVTGLYSGGLSVIEDRTIVYTNGLVDFSKLKKEDILEVSLDAFPEKPSLDLLIYKSIYESSDAKSIVRFNSPHITAMAVFEEKILFLDYETKSLLKSLPVVRPRDLMAFDEVAKFVGPVFKSGYKCAHIKGFCGFAAADTLEDACKLAYMADRGTKALLMS